MASLSAAVVFEAVVSSVGGRPLSVATNLAYPLGDLLLLGLVIAATALNGWRLDRTWGLVGAGIVVFWVADSLYLFLTAAGTYHPGSVFDAGWWAGITLIARAAWTAAPAARVARARAPRLRLVTFPMCFALVGLALLVYAAFARVNPFAVGLAAASLLSVMVRLILTFRDHLATLVATRAESLSDALTGLGNRRALELELHACFARGGCHELRSLVLFDLDGFKHYNDSFGHPSGDALLGRLGDSFARALEGRGRAYRMGGDEFCALIDAPVQLAGPIIAAAAAALTEVGEAFTVGCSYGAVDLGSEAQDGSAAMGLADRRMYVNKRDGRASASRQSADVLSQALLERNAALGQHLDQVAALAREVAALLEMTPHEVHQVGQAAKLHDVGKVAIPDGILNKPRPLDDAEWAFVRRHTIIGERIISAAPALTEVAALVRSSHERFDGGGYPDGRSGSQIPRGAQVIAVCDSFDAMTNERPYGGVRSRDAALAELRRCAGSQFDPEVVRAFQIVMDRAPSCSPGVLEGAVA